MASLNPSSLNPSNIVKQGYLTKSPPMHDTSIIRRRWRLRWFVLYDNYNTSSDFVDGDREIYLLYYKNDKDVIKGEPKGKISLINTDVSRQRGKLYGYKHVINISTEERMYHLCATQVYVCDEWLDAIRQHHVPFTKREYSPCDTTLRPIPTLPRPNTTIPRPNTTLDRRVSGSCDDLIEVTSFNKREGNGDVKVRCHSDGPRTCWESDSEDDDDYLDISRHQQQHESHNRSHTTKGKNVDDNVDSVIDRMNQHNISQGRLVKGLYTSPPLISVSDIQDDSSVDSEDSGFGGSLGGSVPPSPVPRPKSTLSPSYGSPRLSSLSPSYNLSGPTPLLPPSCNSSRPTSLSPSYNPMRPTSLSPSHNSSRPMSLSQSYNLSRPISPLSTSYNSLLTPKPIPTSTSISPSYNSLSPQPRAEIPSSLAALLRIDSSNYIANNYVFGEFVGPKLSSTP